MPGPAEHPDRPPAGSNRRRFDDSSRAFLSQRLSKATIDLQQGLTWPLDVGDSKGHGTLSAAMGPTPIDCLGYQKILILIGISAGLAPTGQLAQARITTYRQRDCDIS
jgi:hypothetical protein